MRIIDKIKADGVHISFEVFPPKTDAGFESVLKATDGSQSLPRHLLVLPMEPVVEPVRIRLILQVISRMT